MCLSVCLFAVPNRDHFTVWFAWTDLRLFSSSIRTVIHLPPSSEPNHREDSTTTTTIQRGKIKSDYIITCLNEAEMNTTAEEAAAEAAATVAKVEPSWPPWTQEKGKWAFISLSRLLCLLMQIANHDKYGDEWARERLFSSPLSCFAAGSSILRCITDAQAKIAEIAKKLTDYCSPDAFSLYLLISFTPKVQAGRQLSSISQFNHQPADTWIQPVCQLQLTI